MPIPNPRTYETEDEFISRCMADDTMVDEYPEEDQRFGVCQTSWDEGDKENNKMSEKMLIKALEFVVKQDDADDRTLEFVGSTEKWDRDDEIILASAWMLDSYRQNPVVLFAHDHYSPAIGKTTSVSVNKDGELRFKVKFAEPEVYGFADTIYKLYKGGYMSAVSVGLLPLEWTYGKTAEEPYRVITKAELFEISMVAVGANPDALVSSRGVMKAVKEGAVDQVEIDELIMMLKDMAKKPKKVEEKEEETPKTTIKVTLETLDSEEFKRFLEENGLKIVEAVKEDTESKTQETEDPELDIYDVLLQDLKAGKEPHEKSHGDEDLAEELIALLKSETN